MKILSIKTFILVMLVLCSPVISPGAVLKTDTAWSGKVVLKENILVPEGITLIVLPGTTVNIEPSDRTKSGPEYLSSLTEITVRGRLEIEGKKGEPVVFRVKGKESPGHWGGLIIDGGSADVRWATFKNAETGITVLKGKLSMADSVLRENRYGLAAYEGAFINMKNTSVTENDFGIFELGSVKTYYHGVSIRGNSKKDLYSYGKKSSRRGIEQYRKSAVYRRSSAGCKVSYSGIQKVYTLPDTKITRIYASEVLTDDTIWKGRIGIEGLLRVPRNVRLIIMPGTIVEFRKEDSNGDGIGENGIMMQGVLIAKGTEEAPIIFRSGERVRGMGDWDSIYIMNSDGAENLIEYVQIEDAYKGLHFHFSNVLVNGAVLKNNYCAIQLQKSTVELRGNDIYNNKSGIKGRDSEIVFLNNNVYENINGLNFFRSSLNAEGNRVLGNRVEGFRVKEGTNTLRDNIIDCNRSGLMISDSFFGKYERNFITNNYETGVSIRNSNNIELTDNFIQDSGFNGISILSSGGTINGNHITANGERGIGIRSFNGIITGNTIVGNGLYAIENESQSDVLAPLNWWGERRADKVIYDKFDDDTRGMVIFSPAGPPVPYEWRIDTVRKNFKWYGSILIRDHVDVVEGATLKIAPDTQVLFAEGAGMKISESRIIAKGRDKKRIRFTSVSKDPERLWGEILVEHAGGSVFSYCDFEYATWALDSQFTNLIVKNSEFRKNDVGIRLRSGPVVIAESVFTENRIGLRAFMANGVIRDSDFYMNETGVFVREKGGGLRFRNNNLYSNTGYSIRVGDFNVEDVDARENWWGTDTPEETIFDGRREPGVGIVIFEPQLPEQLRVDEEETEEGAETTMGGELDE